MAYWNDEAERKCRGIFTRYRKDKTREDIFSTQPAGPTRETCTQLSGPLGLRTCPSTWHLNPAARTTRHVYWHLRPATLGGPWQPLYHVSHARDKPRGGNQVIWFGFDSGCFGST
ncbi:hypothetical protein GQ457_12G026410 [Hibiscus cannabinus]